MNDIEGIRTASLNSDRFSSQKGRNVPDLVRIGTNARQQDHTCQQIFCSNRNKYLWERHNINHKVISGLFKGSNPRTKIHKGRSRTQRSRFPDHVDIWSM